jgi:hypothetical protein
MAWEVRGYHDSSEFSLADWLQHKKPLLDYLDGMWNGAFWKVEFDVPDWSSVDDAKEKMEAFAKGCVCRLFKVDLEAVELEWGERSEDPIGWLMGPSSWRSCLVAKRKV